MDRSDLWTRTMWAPLSGSLLIFTPQRVVHVRVIDGPSDRYEGFPLLWMRDGVSSGDFTAFMGPLLVNLLAFAALAWCFVRLWSAATHKMPALVRNGAALMVWLSGVGAYLMFLFVFAALGNAEERWFLSINSADIIASRWSRF